MLRLTTLRALILPILRCHPLNPSTSPKTRTVLASDSFRCACPCTLPGLCKLLKCLPVARSNNAVEGGECVTRSFRLLFRSKAKGFRHCVKQSHPARRPMPWKNNSNSLQSKLFLGQNPDRCHRSCQCFKRSKRCEYSWEFCGPTRSACPPPTVGDLHCGSRDDARITIQLCHAKALQNSALSLHWSRGVEMDHQSRGGGGAYGAAPPSNSGANFPHLRPIREAWQVPVTSSIRSPSHGVLHASISTGKPPLFVHREDRFQGLLPHVVLRCPRQHIHCHTRASFS